MLHLKIMENLNDQPSQTEMVPERCHQAGRKISEKRLVGLDEGFVYSFSCNEENISELIFLGEISLSDSSCLRMVSEIDLSRKNNVLFGSVYRMITACR